MDEGRCRTHLSPCIDRIACGPIETRGGDELDAIGRIVKVKVRSDRVASLWQSFASSPNSIPGLCACNQHSQPYIPSLAFPRPGSRCKDYICFQVMDTGAPSLQGIPGV